MNGVDRGAAQAFQRVFGEAPRVVATAPGRINLIGEHTDYNEGFVLPFAIEQRIGVALGFGGGKVYSADFDELQDVRSSPQGNWSDYPAGVGWSLGRAGLGIGAFKAAIAGDVPRGAGLSSSAAVETATALGLDALFELGLDRQELAGRCQEAENEFVGLHSGIMDQLAVLLCHHDRALLIDCRSRVTRSLPLELESAGLTLLVCNTGRNVALASSAYNDRRRSCERAAAALHLPSLRNADEASLCDVPEEDAKRVRHVIRENQRVSRAVEALGDRDFVMLGRVMVESHCSLRDDYEVSTPALNAFVETAIDGGALGARLTGAGFGGCAIAIIEDRLVPPLIRVVLELFSRAQFPQPAFYRVHPSPGATVEMCSLNG